MNNIIVFLQNRNFFGAQINHIPILKYLKSNYPKANLIIITKHKISRILLELGYVDRIIYDNSKFSTLKIYLRINPDLTINLRKKSSFINLYVGLLNFKKKIGFKTFLTSLFFTKVSMYNSEIYRALNYLNLVDVPLEIENKILTKRVLIIPGAGGDFKIWDLKNYILVAKELQKKYKGYEISFIIGEKEKPFLNQLNKTVFTVYYNLKITELYSLIQESELIIANDCGPSHIAQISSSKYLILYTDEDNSASSVILEWFNKSNNSNYIIGENGKSINSIKIEDVLSKIDKLMEIIK